MTAMEPDRIEHALRRDAATSTADDGFTEGLMRVLPPMRPPRPWLKPALVLGATALGSLLAVLLSPLGTLVGEGLLDLARLRPSPQLGVVLAMATVLAVSGWVLSEDD